MRRVAFFIDGWFMRKRIMNLGTFEYTAKNIHRYCMGHLKRFVPWQLVRIFYYDTRPLEEKGHNPITGKALDFSKTDVFSHQTTLFDTIKTTPNMALRLGRVHWRDNAWVLNKNQLKKLIAGKIKVEDLTEYDVKPAIEQKAVDMKMGIDITAYALKHLVDTMIIISGDADMVPALKLARREGVIILLDPLWANVHEDLREHTDYLHTLFQSGEKMWTTIA